MTSQIKRFATLTLVILALHFSLSIAQPQPAFSKERLVIKAMADLNAAQATYHATTGAGSYGTLVQLWFAGLIDQGLASGMKYGYSFAATPGQNSYTATAVPVRYRKSGRWSYYIDQRGILFGRDRGGQPANSTDIYVDTCALYGMADNERCTIHALRTLHGAELTYAATVGGGGYGNLPQLANAALIDIILATGSKHGYSFSVDYGSSPQPYLRIYATPHTYGTTGRRSFFADHSGVIRGADHGGLPSGPDDPPINK